MRLDWIEAAKGSREADLVLKNGMVMNVFTNEFVKADVAVCGSTIVGVGDGYQGRTEVDMSGKYLVPGFIDAHIHVESTMLTPSEFALAAVPKGTTTVIADPHEIANVCGIQGLKYMLSEAENSPMNLFVMLPSCVPASDFDTGGTKLEAEDLVPFRTHPCVLGLGEMMNVPGVLGGDPRVYRKLECFEGGKADGHAPLLGGKGLQAYRLAGISTDHECSSGQEALEKLRAGFAVLVREGSGAHNLADIIAMVKAKGLGCSRLCFCTDDRHADDILREGHIDSLIRKTIELGIDPIESYKMASCYPAQIYGLSRLGALSAGYQADIVVLNSFLNTDICEVYCKGQPAGKNPGFSPVPEDIFHTVHIGPICGEDLCLPLHRCETPVAEVIPGQINTRLVYEKVFSKNGCFEPGGPYRKVAVVERHRATGNVGLGIIKGLPVKGAVATTVAHDSHNVVVVGDNDEDMLLAIWELERCEGGYTIVRRGKVLETLPLPIGGLMSSRSACEVAKQLEKMKEIFADMGIPEEIDSFHAMSFLTLPVLPEARITDRGMFDAVRFEYITL